MPGNKLADRPMVSADYIKETMTALDIRTLRRLGSELGVSGSSLSKYQKEGKMPKTLRLAMEGLRRRFKQNERPLYILQAANTDQEVLLDGMLKQMDIHYMKWSPRV